MTDLYNKSLNWSITYNSESFKVEQRILLSMHKAACIGILSNNASASAQLGEKRTLQALSLASSPTLLFFLFLRLLFLQGLKQAI